MQLIKCKGKVVNSAKALYCSLVCSCDMAVYVEYSLQLRRLWQHLVIVAAYDFKTNIKQNCSLWGTDQEYESSSRDRQIQI